MLFSPMQISKINPQPEYNNSGLVVSFAAASEPKSEGLK